MSELGELLAQYSCTNNRSMDDLIKEYGGEVTIVGYAGEQVGKYGLTPVLKIAEEGGQTFWASGKVFKDMLAGMLAKYGSDEAIDAAFAANPQRIRLHKVRPGKNGNPFRPIEFLKD